MTTDETILAIEDQHDRYQQLCKEEVDEERMQEGDADTVGIDDRYRTGT